MKFWKLLKSSLEKVDSFRTTQLLRYKTKPVHGTTFGGITSIVIFFTLTVSFYNLLIQCLQKSHIDLSGSSFISADPTPIEISAYPNGKFMLGVQIFDLDLNSPPKRYFDLVLSSVFKTYDIVSKTWHTETLQYSLEPCTNEHFQAFPDALKQLESNSFHMFACMPKGMTFSLQGKLVSPNLKTLMVEVRKCTNQFDPKKSCASQEEIDEFFKIQETIVVEVFLINASINPVEKDYLKYFLDYRYEIYFTKSQGSQGTIYVQDFKIETDQSVHFVPDIHIQTGGIITNQFHPKYYDMTVFKKNTYCQFIFMKSPISQRYKRSFQTLDNVISFVGGLLQAAYSFLFVLKFYNNFVYEISLGSQLFKDQKAYRKHSLLSYLKLNCFKLISKMGFSLQWYSSIEYEQCQKQMERQLDVVYLLKKICFMEGAVSGLLSKHQVKGLHLRQRLTLNEVKSSRRAFKVRQRFRRTEYTKMYKKARFRKLFPNSDYIDEKNIIGTRFGQVDPMHYTSESEQNDLRSRKISYFTYLENLLWEDQNESSSSEEEYQQMFEEIIKIEEEAVQSQFATNKSISLSKESSMKELLEKPYQKKIKKRSCFDTDIEQVKPIGTTKKKTKADCFCTTELLRYKSEPQHKTVFGGIVTILIFIVLTITLYGRLIACLQKINIASSESSSVSSDPTLIEISTYPKGNFMLAMEIMNLDLNSPPTRYFNLRISNYHHTYNQTEQAWDDHTEYFKFEQCTPQHWERFPEALNELNIHNMSRFVCFPMNMTFYLQGKEISSNFKTLYIEIRRCLDSFDPKRPCAPKDEINAWLKSEQTVVANLYFMNPQINAENQDYLNYYLDDRYYTYFSMTQGSQGTIYMEDFEIETDESIYFVEDKQVQQGGIITEQFTAKSYDFVPKYNNYCRFMFYKSTISKQYTRSFEKIDSIISFIGGLLGIIYACLFVVVNAYNNFAYEISMGSELFKPQKTEKHTFKKYNFLSFLKQHFYSLLQIIGFSPQWQSTIEYKKCQKQMEKQLDVVYLLKRVLFLESAVSILLSDHQVKGLHLRQKLTLREAKNRRKAYKIRKQFHKFQQAKKQKKSQQEKAQNSNSNADSFSDHSTHSNVFQKDEIGLYAITPGDFQSHENILQIQQKDLPQQIQDLLWQSSSDSSSEQSMPEDQRRMFEEIQKLQEEALNGQEMSKKIVSLTRKSIKQALFNLNPRKMVTHLPQKQSKEGQKQENELNINYSRFRTTDQNQRTQPDYEINFSFKKSRPFRKRQSPVSRRIPSTQRKETVKSKRRISTKIVKSPSVCSSEESRQS